MIDYDSFEEFRDADLYDLVDAGYYDDYALVEQWARELGGPLLDLACGTGRMALRMVEHGYEVTGVDIVPEMLDRARKKAVEQDTSIEWVQADARTLQLQRRFSLIYMLENAFQFFWTREDQEALLTRVQEHLLPGGCFLFETRNPSPRNLLHVHHPDPQKYALPDGGQLIITEEQFYDPMTQIQHYTTHQTFFHPDGKREEKSLRTALRYTFPQEIRTLLYYNGFQIRACYGNWLQEPLTSESPAMIFVCQRRV